MRPVGYTVKRVQDAGRGVKLERELSARNTWTREQLAAHQREAREAIVRHAVERSPLYRELYAGGDAPVVTKALLMERFDEWCTDRRLTFRAVDAHLGSLTRDAYLFGQYRAMATGGTTGRRGMFIYDRAEWAMLLGLMQRESRAHGLRPSIPRPRLAVVAAPSPLHMTRRISDTLDIGLFKRLQLSATQPVDELVRELNAFRPTVLLGYPSVVSMLADEQLAGRLRIAPPAVVTTSEVCTPDMRDRIREAWPVDPHEMYGATDGLWGGTCEHHRMHFAEDCTLVEVEDERILVTNLFMRTQPVIRYEITDLVRVSDEPCPCGRPFRVVEAIEGRSDDILQLPGAHGRDVPVHPISLRSPLAKIGGLRQYQVVHRVDGLHVHAVPRNGATALADEVRAALEGALRAAGVTATPVHVDLVDALERDPGAVGKLKLVRSEVAAS
jgi:putative adenylate-forming enzyme